MRRIVSWILVILIVLIFAYDIYFVIAGTIEVKNQLDRLEASNASGHEYLGVPIDIVVIVTIIFVNLIIGLLVKFQHREIHIPAKLVFYSIFDNIFFHIHIPFVFKNFL